MKPFDAPRAQAASEELLHSIGEDPTRAGLLDTPARVSKAWAELTAGYHDDPARHLTLFDGESYEGLVCLGPVTFYSTCEHHLLPFFGKAWVSYRPSAHTNQIIGLSKLARFVEVYARRLQVQERLTSQIADALSDLLEPDFYGVRIEAQHFCMMARGVKQHTPAMVTLETLGSDQDRAEFLDFCRSKP